MKESIYRNVKHQFVDEDGQHRHLIDGAETISCTTFLRKVGILPEYPQTESVRQAAERGTLIHAEIEGARPVLSDEATWARKFIRDNYDSYEQETLVSYNGVYAGICDFYGWNKHDNCIDIIDWKTGVVKPDNVAWQLMCYYKALCWMGYMSREDDVRFLVGDLKADKCSVYTVVKPADEEFSRMLDLYAEGKTYVEPTFALDVANNSTNVERVDIERFLSLWNEMPITLRYEIYKNMEKEAKSFTEDYIKKPLIESGLKRGVTPDGYVFELSYRKSKRLDVEKLKKLAPKAYEKSLVETESVALLYKHRGKEGDK